MENAEQWRSLCIIGLVSVGFIQVFCHVYPEIFSNGRNDMAEGLDCDGYLDGGALFLYRIWWIKKTRKKLRMQPRRKNPLRWFSMIPVTLLLDILFVVWGCYQDAFFWERQYERLLAEGELGHGLPLISVLCVLFAGAVTAGITVLSVILVCISRYRSRYER